MNEWGSEIIQISYDGLVSNFGPRGQNQFLKRAIMENVKMLDFNSDNGEKWGKKTTNYNVDLCVLHPIDEIMLF